MDALTTILAEDGPEAVMAQVMKGLDLHLVEQHPAVWRCPCSRERVADALRSIGEDSLRELASEEKETEVSCQFCGKQYLFLPEDLLELLPEKTGDSAASDRQEESE